MSTGYTTGSPPTNNCVTPGGSGISLTTIGSSGAATLIGSVLNIPVYGGGSGTVAECYRDMPDRSGYRYHHTGSFGSMPTESRAPL